MNRVSKILIVVVLMLLMVAPLAGAKEESIVDITVGDGRFDTLAAAVVAAGLDDVLAGGEWTVFAPTDDAFAKLGLNEGNIASKYSKAELKDIVLYHVLAGDVSSAQLKARQGDVAMANDKLAGLKYFRGSMFVNDDSRVIIENIIADNGRIHVVDTVILQPWPRDSEDAAMEMPTETTMTATAAQESPAAAATEAADMTADTAATPTTSSNSIVDVASGDARFSTLVAAIVAADLADDLSGGKWTVFAPTDDAFAKLGLNAGNIASKNSKAELQDIVLYHVLAGDVSSAQLKARQGDVAMANDKLAGLKYFRGSMFVNDDSRLISENIIADNGRIHVVDNVVLQPWPKN